MKEKVHSKDAQNTLDTHAPDRPETQQLSEKEKKQMELSGRVEHAQGEEREAIAEEAEEKDRGPAAAD